MLRELEDLQIEPRALGRSDYPDELPLREVAIISKHCSGGVILGFRQFETNAGVWKRGTDVFVHKMPSDPIIFGFIA